MDMEEMKRKKAETGMTLEQIAEASGVPVATVQKIFSGTTRTPRKLTMDAIERAFTAEGENRSWSGYDFSAHTAGVFREPSLSYGTAAEERRYTIDDYYALSDEQRMELIDGKFYDMTAPSWEHQVILGELYLLFRECADAHNMPCEVYLSPCDVRLDMDEYTMVQPDLLVVCSFEHTDERRIEGAPDLVVEILSPSTRRKDQTLKLFKYQNAGVREYWIVDARNRKIVVHCFEEEDYCPVIYGFDSDIPIRISGGECSIDFSRVLKRIERHGR